MPNLSTLVTNTIPPSSISADKLSGGQSGSAPVYGCRAWANFSGELTNVTGNSYSRSGTTVTVTRNAHNLSTGNRLLISSATDTGLNTEANTASREIVVTGPNTFTFQTSSTGTATGTLTYALGIRASGNVSKIQRLDTGNYKVFFITPMTDTNYSVAVTAQRKGISGVWYDSTQILGEIIDTSSFTTDIQRGGVVYPGFTGQRTNHEIICVQVFR